MLSASIVIESGYKFELVPCLQMEDDMAKTALNKYNASLTVDVLQVVLMFIYTSNEL